MQNRIEGVDQDKALAVDADCFEPPKYSLNVIRYCDEIKPAQHGSEGNSTSNHSPRVVVCMGHFIDAISNIRARKLHLPIHLAPEGGAVYSARRSTAL